MTSMHPNEYAIRQAVAGFHNPAIFMDKTETRQIIETRRNAYLLFLGTMDYDDAAEWNKLTQANGWCFQALTAGKRAASKVYAAEIAIKAHMRQRDDTEIWQNQLDWLTRRHADAQVRLQDARMTYKAATDVYELVAQGFADAGHDVETKWRTPEDRAKARECRHITPEAYAANPDVAVFDRTKFGVAA